MEGTYEFGELSGGLGACAGEEGGNAVREPGLGHWGALWDAGVAAEGGVLDEEEDQENGCTDGSKSPPEDVFPRLGLGDKATQSAATDDGKDDQHLKDGKGFTALV